LNGLAPTVVTPQQEKRSPGQAGQQASTSTSNTSKTTFRTLERAWKRASPKVRSQFLDWLAKDENVASKLRKLLVESATAKTTAMP
jgi:hypothetical protein